MDQNPSNVISTELCAGWCVNVCLSLPSVTAGCDWPVGPRSCRSSSRLRMSIKRSRLPEADEPVPSFMLSSWLPVLCFLVPWDYWRNPLKTLPVNLFHCSSGFPPFV
ncbi:hypothetical protein AMECASPLE_001592 [Ameca splendens]